MRIDRVRAAAAARSRGHSGTGTAIIRGRAFYVEDGMWNDPEYLDSIRRYGQRLTLVEGDSRTRMLKEVTP